MPSIDQTRKGIKGRGLLDFSLNKVVISLGSLLLRGVSVSLSLEHCGDPASFCIYLFWSHIPELGKQPQGGLETL